METFELKVLLGLSFIIYLMVLALHLRTHWHMLQLNSYRNERYWKWVESHKGKAWDPKAFLFILSSLVFWGEKYLGCALWLAAGLFLLGRRERREKKRFVLTNRAKRLVVTTLLVFCVLLTAVWYVLPGGGSGKLVVFGVFLSLVYLGAPVIVWAANFLNGPLEKAINQWYLKDAQRILKQMPDLVVVGITGSYGKTSTKYILSRMLSEKYEVLMTPESYNTPMGVTITVRTMLRPMHQVLVVEMGARQPGDIKELCDLVKPKIGILTSIGEQHLETFGSLKNIKETKFELARSLPSGGMLFLNYDDENIRSLPELSGVEVIRCAVGYEGAEYRAEKVRYGPTGLSLEIVTPSGEVLPITTRLIGSHNVSNLLLAAAAAHRMGVDLEKIKVAARKLEPVPHRLELKPTKGGITVIDDAFNSNLKGAKAALEVLGSMEGTRILVTPGLVELGEMEEDANRTLGSWAASYCDYVILVGPSRTRPILEGLIKAGFEEEKILVAKNLKQALEYLPKVALPPAVVLFENDLPDTYEE